jgi:hypothetical protein
VAFSIWRRKMGKNDRKRKKGLERGESSLRKTQEKSIIDGRNNWMLGQFHIQHEYNYIISILNRSFCFIVEICVKKPSLNLLNENNQCAMSTISSSFHVHRLVRHPQNNQNDMTIIDDWLIQNSKSNIKVVWIVKSLIDEKEKCLIFMWQNWWTMRADSRNRLS